MQQKIDILSAGDKPSGNLEQEAIASADSEPGVGWRTARAALLIRRQYQNPELSLKILAAECGVTRWHLCRSFRREMSCGIPQYIEINRVEAAEDLLVSTPLSIKEIAAKIGFKNSAVLDRSFKRVVGVTPLQFRQIHITHRSELQLPPGLSTMRGKPRP